MSVIPGNKLQERARQQRAVAAAPHGATTHSIDVVVLEVYDHDTVDFQDPPEELQRAYRVGYSVYAKVVDGSGRPFIVPMKDAALVQLVYGNSSMIKGYRGKVEYIGLKPSSGLLVISGDGRPMKNQMLTTLVFDISGAL